MKKEFIKVLPHEIPKSSTFRFEGAIDTSDKSKYVLKEAFLIIYIF
jgi:hypothetical protein